MLINNAGIGTAGDILETTDEDLERTLAVNVRGVFNTCRVVMPSMLEAGDGIIVNVASIVAHAAVTRRAAYTASKGAILALTRSIAIDFMNRGIRCNAVAPGTVDSPWIDRILSDAPDKAVARQAMVDRQPLGRLGITPVTDTLRGLLLGTPVGDSWVAAVVWCLGIFVVARVLAARLFRRAH